MAAYAMNKSSCHSKRKKKEGNKSRRHAHQDRVGKAMIDSVVIDRENSDCSSEYK